jgi:hypothetical protein
MREWLTLALWIELVLVGLCIVLMMQPEFLFRTLSAHTRLSIRSLGYLCLGLLFMWSFVVGSLRTLVAWQGS